MDLGYSFNDVYSNTGTCLPVSSRSSVIPVQGGALSYCYDPTVDTRTAMPGDYAVVARYQGRANSGYFNVTYRPVKRVTLNAGYDITNTGGSDDVYRADTLAPLLLQQSRLQAGGSATTFVPYNPNVPLGPLGINYHKPSAGALVQITRGIALRGEFSYYGYNEKSVAGPAGLLNGSAWIGVPPRDFHGTLGVVALRYQF